MPHVRLRSVRVRESMGAHAGQSVAADTAFASGLDEHAEGRRDQPGTWRSTTCTMVRNGAEISRRCSDATDLGELK